MKYQYRSIGVEAPRQAGRRASSTSEIMRFGKTSGLFPTLLVDVLSVLPLLVGSVFVVMTDRFELRTSFVPRWTFEPTNYWAEITCDWKHIAAFGLYTMDVISSLAMVVFHVGVRHHPKHNASRGNKLSITAHIIGGTVAVFGFFGGLVSGSKWPILAACIGSFFLHSPSIWWQQRNVYGHRDLTLPSYTLLGFVMPVAVLNVIWEDASFRTLFAAGMALNVFAMVRTLYMIMIALDMSPKLGYERAVLLAGLIHCPWYGGGEFGILIFCLFVLLWNQLFNFLRPFSRYLLSHNFHPYSVADLIGPKGVDIRDAFARLRKEMRGEPERQAAVAAYETFKTGEYMTLPDLQRLFMSWGMVGGMKFAEECFEDADENECGYLTAEEFEAHFEFVYLPILHYGAMDTKTQEA